MPPEQASNEASLDTTLDTSFEQDVDYGSGPTAASKDDDDSFHVIAKIGPGCKKAVVTTPLIACAKKRAVHHAPWHEGKCNRALSSCAGGWIFP
eukprot:scaffold2120_cov169-Amphora_coffeaeformis.AAC.20